MASLVVSWLTEQGWTVYQEVQPFRSGPIADIVATIEVGKTTICWIIETKLSFSSAVVDQAYHWLYHADLVSVAVPPVKRKHHICLEMFMREHGIGLIVVGHEVKESTSIMPRLNRGDRITKKRLMARLAEEHKTHKMAGTVGGGRFTPFNKTVIALKEYIRLNPGCTIKDVVDNINHHYHTNTTAKQSLMTWISKDVIKGIKKEYRGNKTFLYLADVVQSVEQLICTQ